MEKSVQNVAFSKKADRNAELASTESITTNLRKAGPANVSQTDLEARMW
jgi:hypothetical protein